jgi:hypothetical protein
VAVGFVEGLEGREGEGEVGLEDRLLLGMLVKVVDGI